MTTKKHNVVILTTFVGGVDGGNLKDCLFFINHLLFIRCVIDSIIIIFLSCFVDVELHPFCGHVCNHFYHCSNHICIFMCIFSCLEPLGGKSKCHGRFWQWWLAPHDMCRGWKSCLPFLTSLRINVWLWSNLQGSASRKCAVMRINFV